MYTCALHDLVPPTVWNHVCDVHLGPFLELSQKSPYPKSIYPFKVYVVCLCVVSTCVCVSIQLTHSSASSHGSHVSPALDRLPALPLQVWLTGFDEDGPPTTSTS